MNYIDEGNTLPVPFNMIPTPKSFRYAYYWLREVTGHGAALTEAKQNKRQAGVSVSIHTLTTIELGYIYTNQIYIVYKYINYGVPKLKIHYP